MCEHDLEPACNARKIKTGYKLRVLPGMPTTLNTPLSFSTRCGAFKWLELIFHVPLQGRVRCSQNQANLAEN